MTAITNSDLLDWMNMLASGPAEAWKHRVADDVTIRLPFAPPGVTTEMHGAEQAIAIMTEHWALIEQFEWRDVVVLRTEDPELFVTTAKSHVLFRSGVRYENDYINVTRFRDGLVVDHAEYFNPLPVLNMLESA
jgi:ketosteroid isomerase-like protein